MSTEKMSAEFEVWRNEQIASLMRTGHVQATRTFRDLGSIHWMAWQSAWVLSRAAIEVELPPLSGMDTSFVDDGIQKTREHNRYNAAVNDCRKSIESHGLKVRP